MGKKLAILQSNYIPWKGYFDLMAAADEFILYDDVQFTKNDWRNRNQIKTPRGNEWLSVPVGQHIHRQIREVVIATHDWQRSHWNKICESYRSTPHFKDVAAWLEPLYLSEIHQNLSTMNERFLRAICQQLGINTPISHAWDYSSGQGQTSRLVDLCKAVGATCYLSGPAAKAYLDITLFKTEGIAVEWFDYDGYPEYPQPWGAFTHHVSIVDLLCNVGQDAPTFMKMARP